MGKKLEVTAVNNGARFLVRVEPQGEERVPFFRESDANKFAAADLLIEALLGCRRSDGHGEYLNCWCDSECGIVDHVAGMKPGQHTHYCLDAKAALAASRVSEESDG